MADERKSFGKGVRDTIPVTIKSGDTVATTVIDLYTCFLAGLIFPSTFDGTAMTFQVSNDNVTYQALYDKYGAQISYVVAASHSITVDGNDFAGWSYVKLVAGTAQSGSDTIITAVIGA